MANELFELEHYKVFEKIATGGMAEIYLASLKKGFLANQLFVVKKILPALSNQSEFIVYLKDEAQALSRLQQSNIVQFHDFFCEKDQFYLVTEYIHGKTLRDMNSDLKKISHKFSVENIVYIIQELASGLDHAHQSYDLLLNKPLNLVHRDVNPQNIMISYDGHVKLIDFGISKFDTRDDFTKTGILKGKFSYMSPEQVEGNEVDLRTDIFALGIIMWEQLTSKRLFDADEDKEKVEKVKNHQIASVLDFNPELPQELNIILMKALARDPLERYQTAFDFKNDLNKFMLTFYPDFKPMQFRQFIRSFYDAEYTQSVEKLKGYLNVNMGEADLDLKTVIIDKETKDELEFTKSQTSTYFHHTNSTQKSIQLPNSFEEKMNKSKLKLDFPVAADQAEVERNTARKIKKDRRERATSLNPDRYAVQADFIRSTVYQPKKSDTVYKSIINVIIAILLATGVYFIYRSGQLNNLNTWAQQKFLKN